MPLTAFSFFPWLSVSPQNLDRQVGTYSYLCTGGDTDNGNILCTENWVINGCSIQRIGDYNANNQPVNQAVWTVVGRKSCQFKSNRINSLLFQNDQVCLCV